MRKTEMEKKLAELLDERWSYFTSNTDNHDMAIAEHCYYQGICTVISQIGGGWERKPDGTHYVELN